MLHFDGVNFTPVAPPLNDRNATALFKVWGIGSKLFAVGSNGLIIEYDGVEWNQVPTGPEANDDFVSLWGTSEDNIVAVGGRSNGILSTYDGANWTTQGLAPVPGVLAIYMVEPNEAVVGGQQGYVGSYDVVADVLTDEEAPTDQIIHAVWGDGAGKFYGVGNLSPSEGFALVRSLETVGN